MSKSAGNVIDPFVLSEKYGADAVRYYLMSDIVIGQDADFSEERLIERYNADLANSLGNLLNRALSMSQRYRAGRLRNIPLEDLSEDVNSGYKDLLKKFTSAMDVHEVSQGIGHLIRHVEFFNWFIENHAPWALQKSAEASDQAELDEVLYDCAESLRIIAILISPMSPKAAHGIFDQLNWKMESSGKEERFSLADTEWGRLPDGHVVEKPVPLFPRIEMGEGV